MTAKRRRRPLARALVAVAAVAAAAIGGAAWVVLGLPGGANRGTEVRVFVRKGAPFREAAESLAARGLVGSARLFGAYARFRGQDRSLRWGTYVLRDAMSWEQLLTSLRLARGVVHTVTILEGWTLAEIAPLVGEALDLPADSVIAAAGDSALRRRVGAPTPTLEGYLFPDTYAFPDRASAREAIRTMVARFEEQWSPAWDSLLPRLRMTRHQAVTLASIVEREARRADERPIIAAVYHNRLREGMPLQADPTIDYALGRRPARVLYRDLRVKSPYNTYLNPGLPPGPIGSPGRASIEATVKPADVPYRFFVAGPDGRHEFRRTYAEHLAAIRMVRERARSESTSAGAKTPATPPRDRSP